MPVAKLDNAPRCQHTKLNGQPCAAPARRGRKYCVFHESAHGKRPDHGVRLVEDAMSLQLALYQVMRALDDHALDPKRAALKLYALQIAASNLKRLHEETQGITDAHDVERQKSFIEILLERLQIPEEEVAEIAEEMETSGSGPRSQHAASPSPRKPRTDSPLPTTFDIHACLHQRHDRRARVKNGSTREGALRLRSGQAVCPTLHPFCLSPGA